MPEACPDGRKPNRADNMGSTPRTRETPPINPNRSLDFGEIARLCHAACFSPSRRRSGLRRGVARIRMRTEAGKMPESLIFPIGNGPGVSDDRFGINPMRNLHQTPATKPVSAMRRYELLRKGYHKLQVAVIPGRAITPAVIPGSGRHGLPGNSARTRRGKTPRRTPSPPPTRTKD